MKRVITAIGNEEMYKMLREQEGISVKGTDIQYQEGIIEALDTYQDIDLVILNEDIIGELSLEDLILSITIIKNDIQIILISKEDYGLEENKNIIKIVNSNKNYVDDIIKYLSGKVNINQKNETKNIVRKEEIAYKKVIKEVGLSKNVKIERKVKIANIIKSLSSKIESIVCKHERKKEVLVCIGNSGVRKDYVYSYTIKAFER